jgi:hypothetical protein
MQSDIICKSYIIYKETSHLPETHAYPFLHWTPSHKFLAVQYPKTHYSSALQFTQLSVIPQLMQFPCKQYSLTLHITFSQESV